MSKMSELHAACAQAEALESEPIITNAMLRAQDQERIAELETALSTLREWVRYEANCPCCDEDDQCLEGCTFADDCPSDAEHMEAARQVLRDTNV